MKDKRAITAILLIILNFMLIIVGFSFNDNAYFGMLLSLNIIYSIGSSDVVNKNGRILGGFLSLLVLTILISR